MTKLTKVQLTKRDGMSERRQLRPGDRVKVHAAPFEGVVESVGTEGVFVKDSADSAISLPFAHQYVELIEPADDPSKDPVGTVRTHWQKDSVLIKIRTDMWVAAWHPRDGKGYPVFLSDSDAVGREVIGAVPGTPAWTDEQEKLATRLEATRHRFDAAGNPVSPESGQRLYTAEEVGYYQTTEAELVSEPLERRIAELEAERDGFKARLGEAEHEVDLLRGELDEKAAADDQEWAALNDKEDAHAAGYEEGFKAAEKRLEGRIAELEDEREQGYQDAYHKGYNAGVEATEKRLTEKAARKPFTHAEPECGCDSADDVRCRALWTGDGSEEPPTYVKKVRDADGGLWTREADSYWRSDNFGSLRWGPIIAYAGPYTEVVG